MAVWTWAVGGTPPAVASRELSTASGRTLTMRVDGAWSAQFTLDGRSGEAAAISELASDLTVYRDGVIEPEFRGRITVADDDVDADRHTVRFGAVDYRGLLAHRQIGVAGRVFTGVDQGLIVWTLISESQALTGGDWTVTNGAGATSGTVRDRTYDPGKPLLEAVTELGQVNGGFEWGVDAELALNRYYPTRGAANGVVLDYGGVVSSFSRSRTPADYANSVLATGAEGLTPVAEVSASIGTDPAGRWERSFGFPSIMEQATLAGRGVWLLAEANVVRPEIAVTLAPGRWGGVAHIGVGDTVTAALISGRLSVTGSHRVVEIGVASGEDGTETVQLGLVAA